MLISVKSVDDANKFVAITGKYNFDIDLISGRYAVNGKSIMGIFSLDLSKPIKVQPQTDNYDKLFEELEQFAVK